MPAVPTTPKGLSITEVARDTGLGKDTLRVWERRYGFPTPARDALGERVYASEDVERLALIRRLMLQGHRPGQLAPLSPEALRQLLPQAASSAPLPGAPDVYGVANILALVVADDVAGLRIHLGQALARMGLSAWVQELLAPLMQSVGRAWAQGTLGIHQEHVFSEVLQDLLRQAIRSVPAPDGAARPRVLLTTLPGESHALGLLMAQALLTLEGAVCISLGVQTPLESLLAATKVHQADIVAISATASLPERSLGQAIDSLRAHLPAQVALWLGGAAARSSRNWPPGCVCVADLAAIGPQVQRWRAEALLG